MGNRVFIQRAIAGAVLLLCSASLVAQSDEEIEEIVVTGRFIAADGYSGLKSNVPLRDVPITISSYTQAFMEGIETIRIADLYNYMAGVQRAGNTGYDISIRGFSSGGADRNSLQTDGLPGLAVRFGSPPTVNTERIEVVKGPMSVLYGRIQPGGFINIVTKKPQPEASHQFKLRADAYDVDIGDTLGVTASIDSTGPLNDTGTVLYRFVGELEDTQGFRDNGFSESAYAVGSVTWLPSDRTTVTLALEYRDEDHSLDNFLVAPGRDINLVADITTRYQEPDDIQPETGHSIALTIDHEISDELSWRANFRYVDHEDSALGWENLSFRNATTLRRRDRNQLNIREYTFIDTSLSWTPSLGGVDHNFMIGFNGGRETSNFERKNFDGGNATLDIDIYNPVYGVGVARAAVPSSHRFTTFDALGLYVQDQITLTDNWKAVVGLRFEDFEAVEEDVRGVAADRATSGDDVVPMAGLIYQPDGNWSYYVSWSESFNPPRPDRTDAEGNRDFPAEQGRQLEAGVKSNLLDGRATATFSVFNIEKENVLNRVSGSVYQLTGVEKSQGFEVEVNANVTDNWQLIAGFAYVDATVDEDRNAALVGLRLRNAPEYTASVWNRVQVTDLWGFGLGIAYADQRWGELPRTGSRVRLPDYFVTDFVVYYDHPAVFGTLKIGNVFDETYYESGTNDRRIVPGAPRGFVLSLSRNFGS